VLVAGLVLALGLAVTYGFWLAACAEARRAVQDEFQFWVSKVAYGVAARLESDVQVLLGVVGLFEASDFVSREEFRRYVAALCLGEGYPGIRGVGFSVLVSADEKAEHVARVRQEGFPAYDIWPEGEREFYAPVVYVEPFDGRNLRTLGYDTARQPVRWAAAERARDQGVAALSGKVLLKQDTAADVEPGALLFLPVYGPGAPHDTRAERRANLLGWAFAAVRTQDLMRDVLGTLDFGQLGSALQVDVYDGDRPSPDALLFALLPAAAGVAGGPALQTVRRLDFGGRQWTLVLTAGAEFAARRPSEKAAVIAIGGGLGSLLLALLVGVRTLNHIRVSDALGAAARLNEQLAERERELLWAQRTAQLGSWTQNPTSGEPTWSEGMFHIWGLDAGQGIPDPAAQRRLIHPDDLPRWDAAERAALERGEPYRLELRLLRPDGQERTIVSICTPQCDATLRVVRLSGTNQDITERVRLQEALREQAIRDPLTGLYNRRYLDEILPGEIGRCRRSGESLVLAMLDLDHFKRLNDAHGHEAGDQVLRAVGELLHGFLRIGDLACRYGGEELTLVLPGASLEDAHTRLDDLRKAVMDMRIRYRGGDLPAVTVSVGLAALGAEADAGAVLSRADVALYRAKTAGRNRVVVAAEGPSPGVPG
jgi:diguanylate cyclase (GGDEF)-like protein